MKSKAQFFLRFGIALVFLYAAIASFLDPQSWMGFIPSFITNHITRAYLLSIFSIYEIILSFWLFSGKKTFYAAILSSITLVGIIISNLSQFNIIFRDVAILFAAIALAFLTKEKF